MQQLHGWKEIVKWHSSNGSVTVNMWSMAWTAGKMQLADAAKADVPKQQLALKMGFPT